MPLHDFKCKTCERVYTRLVKNSVTEMPCREPSCKTPAVRIISAGKFRMKGDGFYKSKEGLQ